MKGRIKDLLLIAFLGTLMYLRWKNEEAPWIGLTSYVGVLIALGDLFYEGISNYKNRAGIGIFVLLSVAGGIILVILLANIFVGSIVLDAKDMDILTLLALAISLPHELYITKLGLIFKKTKEVNEHE